jgi:hypothetical protein
LQIFVLYCRFSPGPNKNWKIDVTHCSSESLRKPVHCSVPDVVKTYKSIVNYWPSFKDEEEARHHAFFTPIKFKKGAEVWFKNVPIGRNTLSKIS